MPALAGGVYVGAVYGAVMDISREQAAHWAAYHDRGKKFRNPDPAGRAEEFVALLLRTLEVLRATGREPRKRR